MTYLSRVALAGAFALVLASGAQAQTFAPPQIPTPVNPFPANPVATNGTPLPRELSNGNVYSGRSAFGGPVGGIIDSSLGTAGSLVGTGVGVAGGAVDTGLGTAGRAVDGTVGAVAR